MQIDLPDPWLQQIVEQRAAFIADNRDPSGIVGGPVRDPSCLDKTPHFLFRSARGEGLVRVTVAEVLRDLMGIEGS